MKKLALIVVSLVLCFCLCACGEVSKAERMITSIGNVSLDSGPAIDAAETAVSALKEKQIAKVENLDELRAARAEYERLVEEKRQNDAAIQAVEAVIDEIGTVTFDSAEKIADARREYDALDEGLREQVGNAETLLQAEQSYADACVETIEKAISGIGHVFLQREPNITKARALYDSFSPEIQSRVENYEVLVSAEEELMRRKADAVQTAIASIGEVTVNSEDAIHIARRLYDYYGDEVAEHVENRQLLFDAEQALFDLKKSETIAAIEAIGEVTLQKEEIIKNARSLYKRCEEEVQNEIHNYDVLQQAEERLLELQIQNAQTMIDRIGEITYSNKAAIEAAVAAAERVPTSEREKIANIDKLRQAQKALPEFEAIEHARSIIRVTKVAVSAPDSVGGVELYFNYVNNSDKTIKYVYFGVSFYNTVGDLVTCRIKRDTVNNCYDTGPYKKGEGRTGTWWHWGKFYNWDIVSAKLVSLKIEYTDGTKVELTDKEIGYVQY